MRKLFTKVSNFFKNSKIALLTLLMVLFTTVAQASVPAIILTVSIGSILWFFFYIAIVCLILWFLWWLIGYIGPPPLIVKILRVVVIVIAFIITINFLLTLFGNGFISW